MTEQPSTVPTPSSRRYLPPDQVLDRGFNAVVAWLTAHGVSLYGSRVLAVRGRSSGEWRTTPVNLLTVDHQRYLVAPRGHTQWVRNIRVAGGGELRLGCRAEAFTVEEVPDADKTAILRAYLKTWGWEVGRFFEGIDKHSSDADVARIAPGFPVFRILRSADPKTGGAPLVLGPGSSVVPRTGGSAGPSQPPTAGTLDPCSRPKT